MDRTAKPAHPKAKAPDPAPDQEEFCPWCGLTRRELYAEGQMGCARCYEVFGAEVTQAFQEIHGATEHIGKARPVRQ